jgi:hypothetical protein
LGWALPFPANPIVVVLQLFFLSYVDIDYFFSTKFDDGRQDIRLDFNQSPWSQYTFLVYSSRDLHMHRRAINSMPHQPFFYHSFRVVWDPRKFFFLLPIT